MEKFAELIRSAKDLFNDFVGAVIPGTVLAAGLLWIFSEYIRTDALYRYWGEWSWLPGLSCVFMLGHALLALNDLLWEIPKVAGVASRGWSPKELGIATPGGPSREMAPKAYLEFLEWIKPELQKIGVEGAGPTGEYARNLAMSLSVNGAELGRRFMFIALFCFGTSVAAFVLIIANIAKLIASSETVSVQHFVIDGSLFLLAALLQHRGYVFERRARFVPFSVATAERTLSVLPRG